MKELIGLEIFERFIVLTDYDKLHLGSSFPSNLLGMEFLELQLSTLTRSDIRTLTLAAFDTSDDEYASFIVEKVYSDLSELCIPFTPGNIIMYLKILNSEGSFLPINRIQIVEKYISNAFRTASSDYSDGFNINNKTDLIASFAFSLIASRESGFDQDGWNRFCLDYQKSTLLPFSHIKMLRELISSRIVIEIGSRYFFKYRIFFSYFIGHYLDRDPASLEKFLEDGSLLSMPSLVEVVSAKTSKSRIVLERLVSQLEVAILQFQESYIDDGFDPFNELKWAADDNEDEVLWKPLGERLKEGPKESSEIDKIRTNLIAEKNAENQNVVFERFERIEKKLVKIHLELAKALKNADSLDGDIKIRVASSVLKAHKIVYQVAFMLAPGFLKVRYYYWFGILFHNRMSFDDDVSDEAKLGHMLVAVLNGGIARAADVLGVRKLGSVFVELEKQKSVLGFERAASFSIIVRAKQQGWDGYAKTMIDGMRFDAFYLKSFLKSLQDEYFEGICTSEERIALERLIATVHLKRSSRKEKIKEIDIDRARHLLTVNHQFERKTE